MSCLFVGNLIKAANESKITNVFRSFGKCTVELKGPYAFIEYDDPEEAKIALRDLNKTNLKGVNGVAKARIEFAYKKKGNGKLEDNDILFADDEDVFSGGSDDEDDKSISKKRKSSKEKFPKEREKPHFEDRAENFRGRAKDEFDDDGKGTTTKRKNVCFICRLPGHFAKDCILTKESCYECGEKGHIAKECQANVREAKVLTENRVKAIHSQQSAYKYISAGAKIRNIVNYLKNN